MKHVAAAIAMLLAGCASAPPQAPDIPDQPTIGVVDYECDGKRLASIVVVVTPGQQPMRAAIVISPVVCADGVRNSI